MKEIGFKERMHNARQSKEKKNAKKRREIRDSYRNYEEYPSAQCIKGD